MTTDWHLMKMMEGHLVKVTISREPLVEVTGVLLSLDFEGEARVDTGPEIRCCWPALEMEELWDVDMEEVDDARD